jgi:hypothetical protein
MLIGIYPKKLMFFAVIMLAIVFGPRLGQINFASKPAGEVSASIADNINMTPNSDTYQLEMYLQNDGSVKVNDKVISEGVTPLTDRDELRYLVMDQPNQMYDRAIIILYLPRSIDSLVEPPEIIAVHGAEPVGATLNGDYIQYEAINIGSVSTITITASFPKGYFDLPASKKIAGTVGGIPASLWVVLSLILPAIAGIFFFVLYLKSRPLPMNTPRGSDGILPSDMPPAAVSALIDGGLGARTIMATVLSLASRGYIDIFNKGSDFTINKKEFDEPEANLSEYEKILMDKMFLPQQKTVGAFDVEERVSRHLFSRKVALFYLGVYQEGISRDYYVSSPALVHLRVRLTGIIIFFLGFLGYTLSVVFDVNPKFILFFWISLVIFGVMTVQIYPKVRLLTSKGSIERQKWLRFKNFLSQKVQIRGMDSLFEKYLPYAVAMGCEEAWAGRFLEANFSKPQWYDYFDSVDGADNFIKSLVPIIDYIGNSLSTSSDPSVK